MVPQVIIRCASLLSLVFVVAAVRFILYPIIISQFSPPKTFLQDSEKFRPGPLSVGCRDGQISALYD